MLQIRARFAARRLNGFADALPAQAPMPAHNRARDCRCGRAACAPSHNSESPPAHGSPIGHRQLLHMSKSRMLTSGSAVGCGMEPSKSWAEYDIGAPEDEITCPLRDRRSGRPGNFSVAGWLPWLDSPPERRLFHGRQKGGWPSLGSTRGRRSQYINFTECSSHRL